LPKTLLILRRIQRDVIINVHRSSCRVPVILFRLYSNFNFPYKYSKNLQILNFVKIRPIGADLFHADRQTYRHDAAHIRFSQFVKARNKKKECSYIYIPFTRSISVKIHLNVILIFTYPLFRGTFRRHFLPSYFIHVPISLYEYPPKFCPFLCSKAQIIFTLVDQVCFGSQCTTLLIVASSILFNA
jgi:hypothetical protein